MSALTREEYRLIKNMNRDEMSRWLDYNNLMVKNKAIEEYKKQIENEEEE